MVKGSQVFPVGTRDRWDVIANFIREHSRGKFDRTGKEVLAKTKDLAKLDQSQKEEMNKKAFEKAVLGNKKPIEVEIINEKPSERYVCKFFCNKHCKKTSKFN